MAGFIGGDASRRGGRRAGGVQVRPQPRIGTAENHVLGSGFDVVVLDVDWSVAVVPPDTHGVLPQAGDL